MKLEQQVTNLELSKQLKKLGVKQESLCHWRWPSEELDYGKSDYEDNISAFTSTELINFFKNLSEEDVLEAYGFVFNVSDTKFITARGLQICLFNPDVVAKMLIYLIENKLITVT